MEEGSQAVGAEDGLPTCLHSLRGTKPGIDCMGKSTTVSAWAQVDVVLDSAASGVNTVEREGISIIHPAKFIMIGSGNPAVSVLCYPHASLSGT